MVKRFAATIAILGFFVLTGVGLVSNVPVSECALRGLGGGVVLYIVFRIAGRLFMQVIIDTIVDSAPRGQVEDDQR